MIQFVFLFELRRAIDRGEALGLKPGELTEANRVLKELNKEAWARSVDSGETNKPTIVVVTIHAIE